MNIKQFLENRLDKSDCIEYLQDTLDFIEDIDLKSFSNVSDNGSLVDTGICDITGVCGVIVTLQAHDNTDGSAIEFDCLTDISNALLDLSDKLN